MLGPEAAFLEAAQSHRSSRWGEAEGRYRRILESFPDHVGTLDSLGILLAQVGRVDEAARYFARAAATDSTNPVLFLHWADALKDLGRLDEAVSTYQRAVALDPELTGALLNMANCLKRVGRPNEAIAAYKRCLNADPRSASALTNLGLTQLDANDPTSALKTLDRALVSNPSDPAALYGRASALMVLGHMRRAEEALQGLLKFHPQDHESWMLLAKVQARARTGSRGTELHWKGTPISTRQSALSV